MLLDMVFSTSKDFRDIDEMCNTAKPGIYEGADVENKP